MSDESRLERIEGVLKVLLGCAIRAGCWRDPVTGQDEWEGDKKMLLAELRKMKNPRKVVDELCERECRISFMRMIVWTLEREVQVYHVKDLDSPSDVVKALEYVRSHIRTLEAAQ